MPGITIISGGQTGVDRGALEAAVACAIDYAGWCPKDGWAEDRNTSPGICADYPQLKETPDREPAGRTRRNVCESDAVLALKMRSASAPSPGTQLAIACAGEFLRPCLLLAIDGTGSLASAKDWLAARPRPLRLNIVGPRESEAPGIGLASRLFVLELLSETI